MNALRRSAILILFFLNINSYAIAEEQQEVSQKTNEERYVESQNRAKEYLNWVNQKAIISNFGGLWNYDKALNKVEYCYLAESEYQANRINFKDFDGACQAQIASSIKHYNSILAVFLYIHRGTTDRSFAKEYIRSGVFETNFEFSDQVKRLNDIKKYVILDPLLEFPGFQFSNADKKYAYYTNQDYSAHIMIDKKKLVEYGKNIDLYNSVDTNYFKIKKWHILKTFKPWGEKTGYVVTALEIEPIELKQVPNYKNEHQPL